MPLEWMQTPARQGPRRARERGQQPLGVVERYRILEFEPAGSKPAALDIEPRARAGDSHADRQVVTSTVSSESYSAGDVFASTPRDGGRKARRPMSRRNGVPVIHISRRRSTP